MSSDVELDRQLTAFEEAVAGLSEIDLDLVSDDAIVDLLRRVESRTRALASLTHRMLVQVGERAIPEDHGVGSVRQFLIDTLRLSKTEAVQRTTAAKALGSWHGIDGATRPPVLPHTAHAQAEGAISIEHARRINTIMDRVPAAVEPADREQAEQILACLARSAPPEDIDKAGLQILAHLDPDGTLTGDRDRKRRRGFSIGRQRADLMSPFGGELDPVARALLDPVLAKWARPGMNNPDDPDSPTGDCEHVDRAQLVAAAARDTRTAAQRNHDALAAVLKHALSSGVLGEHRGLPVTAIVTMTLADVENASGVATTASGGLVPIQDALRMAENAHQYLAVFDHHGLPLHLGRQRRLANRYQRLALIAGARGCTRPGCDAPATLTAVHHLTDWAKGGPTDLENLTLACDACHARIHDGPGGWKTIVQQHGSPYPGRAAWIAPPHVDPGRTPHVNHRHHPDELLAEAHHHAPPTPTPESPHTPLDPATRALYLTRIQHCFHQLNHRSRIAANRELATLRSTHSTS
ncbi:HNH endonuclease signature motif containing protein [Nocardia arthritidis]|uniref:DUF222 domain-containing protein n=1 Tax=Nocardia arthritidis TaxID=228602 RepID=A0A6G9YQ42_9NOCA|nr:HNH endonuclease signature motif containing protein [Nocardia arthritidis]QIS15207.1 DUF222 domain-containing protein [Nocardia arthritidis]